VLAAPLAALAFLLLAAEAVGRPARRLRLAREAALAALLVGLGAAPAGAPPPTPGTLERLEALLRAQPREPALLVELGGARLERGRAAEAARAFEAAALASRDPELTALALYDLGVAQLEAGELESARDAFFDALALAPADREARFNLEWTLQALARRPPEPPPAPEPGDREERERLDSDPTAPREAAPRAGAPPPRDPEEVRRWLARVRDDLGVALRLASRAERRERREPGPGW
jgi:tetratricopeptide (TPR) repeat protein